MSKAAPSVENVENDPEAFPRPFGQYLLLQNFARGGMGEVYLAKFGGIAGLEKYCVLKKLRAELTRDREYVTRFIDEARVVVTLNHANICHVFDVGRVGDEYYLAMEYISGRDVRTLQDRCRQRERSIPPATTLHLVCEVLEALDYAHRRNHPISGEPLNLVHRDVSPQNVLVSFEGEVKLIDFGLAASKLKVERTQPNVVMGKMAYMAPEQARGDPIDSRADLFACGVLAYELLAGERFYEGMTANDIWQVAGKGGFVPRRWEAIDGDVAKILAKGLHPDPKKRFDNCGDFREALASHLHWRFPGTGVRGVRDVLAELFAEEVKKERELLSRFGRVTVASFRTTFESTQSHSVSLARADDEESQKSTRVTRNEQSASAPGMTMPPPGSRDLHHEPTRLTSGSGKSARLHDDTTTIGRADPTTAEQTEVTGSGPVARGETAEAPVAEVSTERAPERPRVEPTMRVQRAPAQAAKSPPRPAVKNFDLEMATLSARKKSSSGARAIGAVGALAVAAVVAFVVTRAPPERETPAPSPKPPEPAALAASPTPPVEAAPPVAESAPPIPPPTPAAAPADQASVVAAPPIEALVAPPVSPEPARPARKPPKGKDRPRRETEPDRGAEVVDATPDVKPAPPPPPPLPKPKTLEERAMACPRQCSNALKFPGSPEMRATMLQQCVKAPGCSS